MAKHTSRYYNGVVNGREFIRRARRYARKNGLEFRLYTDRGKGSHQKLVIGDRNTVVQYGEISRGILTAMLRQLNINREEF